MTSDLIGKKTLRCMCAEKTYKVSMVLGEIIDYDDQSGFYKNRHSDGEVEELDREEAEEAITAHENFEETHMKKPGDFKKCNYNLLRLKSYKEVDNDTFYRHAVSKKHVSVQDDPYVIISKLAEREGISFHRAVGHEDIRSKNFLLANCESLHVDTESAKEIRRLPPIHWFSPVIKKDLIENVPRGAIVWSNDVNLYGSYYKYIRGEHHDNFCKPKMNRNTIELSYIDKDFNNLVINNEIEMTYLKVGTPVFWHPLLSFHDFRSYWARIFGWEENSGYTQNKIPIVLKTPKEYIRQKKKKSSKKRKKKKKSSKKRKRNPDNSVKLVDNNIATTTTTTAIVEVKKKPFIRRKNKRRKTGEYIGKRTLEWAEVDPNKPEEELWCFGTVTQKKNSHWIVVYDDDVSSHPKWYDQRQMVESEVKFAIAAYKNPKYKKNKKYKE